MRVMKLLSAIALGTAMTSPAHAAYTIQNLIDDLQTLTDKQLQIQEDVIVVLPAGPLIFNENYHLDPEKNYNAMLTVTARCGPGTGHPVLFAQASGSYEYRWCKVSTGNVGLDMYVYAGGTAQLFDSKLIPCSSTAIPPVVRAQAC